MKESLEVSVENFTKYIIGSTSESTYITEATRKKEDLINMALTGKLKASKCRAMLYKFFLRSLPIQKGIDVWYDIVMEQRMKYLELKKQIIMEEKSKEYNSKLTKEQHKELQEMKKIIELDIERTFQNIPIFLEQKIKKIMFNILYIYSKQNKEVSYKQGMNEILATLLIAIYPNYYPDKKPKNKEDLLNIYKQIIKEDSTKSQFNKTTATNTRQFLIRKQNTTSKTNCTNCIPLYLFFHDENFLEIDLYYLFKAIMDKGIVDFYQSDIIMQRSKKIINDILFAADNVLYKHFVKIGLPYQIYMERWLKCLFNREFDIYDCLILLDVILANQLIDECTNTDKSNIFSSIKNLHKSKTPKKSTSIYEIPRFNYMDYICVGMLVNAREELLVRSNDEILAYCLSYPHFNDIFDLVKLAEDQKRIYHDQKHKKPIRVLKDNYKTSNSVVVGPNKVGKENLGKLIPDEELNDDFAPSHGKNKSINTSLLNFLNTTSEIKKAKIKNSISEINGVNMKGMLPKSSANEALNSKRKSSGYASTTDNDNENNKENNEDYVINKKPTRFIPVRKDSKLSNAKNDEGIFMKPTIAKSFVGINSRTKKKEIKINLNSGLGKKVPDDVPKIDCETCCKALKIIDEIYNEYKSRMLKEEQNAFEDAMSHLKSHIKV